MKTLTTTVMSALLLAGSAFAAQTTATAPAAGTSTTAPKVKKHRHVNKVKKPVAPASNATPAADAAPVKK